MTTERLPFSRWHHVAGIFVSALLLAVYARAPQAWPLGFVALVPWLLALGAVRSLRAVLCSGAAMSVAFVFAVFGWFGVAIGTYTGVGSVTALLVLLALAPLMQPQWVVFALARHVAGRWHGPALQALAAAAAWVASEWLLPKLLGDTLGHGLLPSATLRQVADLGGAAGITLLLLLVNQALALALQRRHRLRHAWRPLAAAVAIVVGMAVYGALRLHTLQFAPTATAPVVRIAMVQANITDYERRRQEVGAYAVVRHVLDTHYALSESAIRDHGADALLWSETVYPTPYGNPRSEDGAALDHEIQGFVDTVGVPLVFGTYDVDAEGEYNAATFLEPGRGRLGTYRKVHPFPLTEYVPPWLDGPWLRRVLPWVGTWRPGDGARVLPIRTADGREVNVVPMICLDDVYTDLAIDGARLGAQAIVGMSNDSWFTAQPLGARLHLAVAAFRSIETRLPQVRVTTNGLSAIIDDTGEVVASTQMGQQAVLTASVAAVNPPLTLMVHWGDWVGPTAAWGLLGLLVLAGWRSWHLQSSDDVAAPAALDVAVLSPTWRATSATLRVCAGLGLLWLAFDMALRIGWQVQSLAQLWRFAGTVLVPALAAEAIARRARARASVERGALVLDQRRTRTEIPLQSIAALVPWRLPLPGSGVDLRLASGRRWGLRVAQPLALQQMLARSGAPVGFANRGDAAWASHAEARGRAQRSWLDRPLLKFGLFPLLPALVAFRLHQVIAFGGTFGELHTYGAAAWFTGLLIWWGAWALGLMLFAAALRVCLEAVCLLVHVVLPARVMGVRHALEWGARVAFYVGVPIWLGVRLLAG